MFRSKHGKTADRYSEIQGNWEERGVIGTRIEIIGDNLTVLWRGGPVLDTEFTVEEKEDGSQELKLAKNGLRYEGSSSDYATVTGITFKDGKLVFEEHFPITGPSETVLTRTENNRYGNYEICGSMFDWLAGSWIDDSGYNTLAFNNDTVTVNGEKIKFVVLKPRWSEKGEYEIRDANASRGLPGGLSSLKTEGDRLTGRINVCDGPSIYLTFNKK